MASVIVENAWSTPIVAKSNAWCATPIGLIRAEII